MNSKKPEHHYILQQRLKSKTPICIVQAGAGAGGIDPSQNIAWLTHFPKNTKIYAYEPDKDQAKKLEIQKKEKSICNFFKINQKALWKKSGKKELYIYINNGANSFLKPIHEQLKDLGSNQISLHDSGIKIQRTETVRLSSIDSEIKNKSIIQPQMLKLNTQGTEIEVLKGAKNSLKKVLLIQSEVAFRKIYKNENNFSQVNNFLERHGFVMLDLVAPLWIGRNDVPDFGMENALAWRWPAKELLQAHVVWVKNPSKKILATLDKEDSIKLIILLEIFGFLELAFFIFKQCQKAGYFTTSFFQKVESETIQKNKIN